MTTERDMLDLLHERLDRQAQGNGGNRWVLAEHVRATAGFGSYRTTERMRTADAMAIDTWPSKGLELHGFEVKCSRSDWLVELRQPEKSEPFRRYCDRWWLVIADAAMVKAAEIPDGWGVMAPQTRYETARVGTDVWCPDWRTPTGWARGRRDYARVPTTTLRVVRPAPRLRPEPLPRSLLACMMRAVKITAERRSEVQ